MQVDNIVTIILRPKCKRVAATHSPDSRVISGRNTTELGSFSVLRLLRLIRVIRVFRHQFGWCIFFSNFAVLSMFLSSCPLCMDSFEGCCAYWVAFGNLSGASWMPHGHWFGRRVLGVKNLHYWLQYDLHSLFDWGGCCLLLSSTFLALYQHAWLVKQQTQAHATKNLLHPIWNHQMNMEWVNNLLPMCRQSNLVWQLDVGVISSWM